MRNSETSESGDGAFEGGGIIDLDEAIATCERSYFPPIYAQDILKLYFSLTHHPRSWDDQRALLVLCFYEVAKSENTPRCLRELSLDQSVSLATLTKLAKLHFPHSSPIHPHLLIHRMGSKAGLTRKQCIEIESQLLKDEHSLHFHHPATVAAAYIYRFVKQCSLDISLEIICKTCLVSSLSVRRFKNKMFLQREQEQNWFQNKNNLEEEAQQPAMISPPQDAPQEIPMEPKEKKPKRRKSSFDQTPILGPPPKARKKTLKPREKWLS